MPATPTPTAQAVTTSLDSPSTTTTPPAVITPTPAAPVVSLRPEDSLAIAGAMGGIDPRHLDKLVKQHGFTVGEDVEVYRRRKLEIAKRDAEQRVEAHRRRKRGLEA